MPHADVDPAMPRAASSPVPGAETELTHGGRQNRAEA